MNASRMQYDYSTKNFHRYGTVNGGAIREVYMPRAEMAQPVAEITVTVAVSGPAVVAEKSKPVRA